MGDFYNLLVYKNRLNYLCQFELSTSYARDKMYSLTNQIRRSSRSTNICLVEACRKRRYNAHFIRKISDRDMDNRETKGWLNY